MDETTLEFYAIRKDLRGSIRIQPYHGQYCVMEGAVPCGAPSMGESVAVYADPTARSERLQLIRVGLFDIQRTIGRGNYAIVKLARHRLLKNDVAVKIIDKTRMDRDSLEKVYQEIEVLKQLHHPYIIRLFQVIESPHFIYIATEYAQNGEVYDLISHNGHLSEDDARMLFWQLISAIEYCHKNGIVHRDIKAENVLLDNTGRIKLADFGFSNFYASNELLQTYCGSPPYAAPEVFAGQAYLGPAVDVWSLGVTLYVMISGALPFEGKNLPELRDRVLNGRFRIPFYMSMECETLIRRMLTIDFNQRITIEQIKQHRWMQIGGHEERVRRDVAAFQMTMDCSPLACVGVLDSLGTPETKLMESLASDNYDHHMCMYQLMMERYRRRNFEAYVLQLREEEDRIRHEMEAANAVPQQPDSPMEEGPPRRTKSEERIPVVPDAAPVMESPHPVIARRPRPLLRTLRGCHQFQTTETVSSMEERSSTLSRQSTVNTVGSIDEGVDMSPTSNGSGTSNSFPQSRGSEPIPLEAYVHRSDSVMSSQGSCHPGSDQNAAVAAPAVNSSAHFFRAAGANDGGSSFTQGLRASDNSVYYSLHNQKFPTGLGRKTKGILELAEPTGDGVAGKTRKNPLDRKKGMMMLSLLPMYKRVSLPDYLEYQPHKLLNLKKSIYVEKQLGNHDVNFESKMLRARVSHLYKRQMNKNRLQMMRDKIPEVSMGELNL